VALHGLVVKRAIRRKKKAANSEIRGDRVDQEDFQQARAKEMKSWLDTEALNTSEGIVVTVDQLDYVQRIEGIPLLGLADSNRSRYNLVGWRCRALPRVVRSTMAGEMIALGDALFTWASTGEGVCW